ARQEHRRLHHRYARVHARIPDLMEWLGGADDLVVQHLTWRVHGSGRNARLLKSRERLRAGVLAAPRVHDVAEECALLAALEIILKPRVVEQLGSAHQARPALEHAGTDHLRDEP